MDFLWIMARFVMDFLLGRPAEKAPEVFRIPQIGAWQKLLQAGCAQAMEQEACQLLDKLMANNQLNSQTLRYFYQDFMQMLFSLPEKKRQDDMFREPEALELYRNGMKTVPDMKALVHYVASVWDSETAAFFLFSEKSICSETPSLFNSSSSTAPVR